MKNIPRILVILPALALALGLASPAWARDGVNDSTSTTESSSGSGTSGSGSGSQSSTEASETETEEVPSSSTSESEVENHVQQRGKDILKTAKLEKKQERTKEDRKKSCDTRKTGLETKLANLNKNANKHLQKIDGVLAKAQVYQKDNNVTVANWDELVAKATTAQANAKASVEALSKLSVTVNCDDIKVVDNVATFKAAAEQARAGLKEYKTAVKNVLVALNQAKEGSDQ